MHTDDNTDTEPGFGESGVFGHVKPNLGQHNELENNINNRHGWSPVDYATQYVDKELVNSIFHCRP